MKSNDTSQKSGSVVDSLGVLPSWMPREKMESLAVERKPCQKASDRELAESYIKFGSAHKAGKPFGMQAEAVYLRLRKMGVKNPIPNRKRGESVNLYKTNRRTNRGTSSQREVGKAGEHVVCSELLMMGHSAHFASEGAPYDIIADINNNLYRVQVKATRGPTFKVECITDKRYYHFTAATRGSKGRRHYHHHEVDMFALVALDTKIVAWFLPKDAKMAMTFRVKNGERHRDEKLNDVRVNAQKLRSAGMTYRKIAKELNLDVTTAYIYQLCNGRRSKRSSFGRYMEDFTLDKIL